MAKTDGDHFEQDADPSLARVIEDAVLSISSVKISLLCSDTENCDPFATEHVFLAISDLETAYRNLKLAHLHDCRSRRPPEEIKKINELRQRALAGDDSAKETYLNMLAGRVKITDCNDG